MKKFCSLLGKISKNKKFFTIICATAGAILFLSSFHPARAQMPVPYGFYWSTRYTLPYFYPMTDFQCRLMNPFPNNRFIPNPVPLAPILAQPFPSFRRAAQTTLLAPSALLASPTSLFASPTSLLLSLLFTPPATTTTVTPITGTTPNSISANQTASPLLTLNRLTTTTTTPILPGLTSLFLPLLI